MVELVVWQNPIYFWGQKVNIGLLSKIERLGQKLYISYLKKLWTSSDKTRWMIGSVTTSRLDFSSDAVHQWDTKRKLFSLVEVYPLPCAVLPCSVLPSVAPWVIFCYFFFICFYASADEVTRGIMFWGSLSVHATAISFCSRDNLRTAKGIQVKLGASTYIMM